MFLIIGEMSDCGTMFVESVKNELSALAVLKSKSLQKSIEVEEVLFTKEYGLVLIYYFQINNY